MTREEAIELLQHTSFFGRSMDDIDTAIDMAIKALEQEPVLDKVRAEIRKKMKFNSFNEGYVLYDDITEVLDKYKTERKEDSFTDECKMLDEDCGKCLYKYNCCSSEYNGRH